MASCYGNISLVPSPPLPLTKWPRKGSSGIFGPIPWFSPSQIILANQILANQIAVWSRVHRKTGAKLVGTSLTCKRFCLDYGYSTFEIELCTCSAEIFDECLTASLRKLHFDFSIIDDQREVIFNCIRGKEESLCPLQCFLTCSSAASSSTDGT